MNIKISNTQYKTLMRCLAISGHIYGIMGDIVDPKYQKHSKDIGSLTSDLLQHNTDPYIQQEYDGKKDFSDEYMNDTMNDIIKYEDFAFLDLIVSKFTKKILNSKIKSMEEEEVIKLTTKTQEKLSKDIVKNGLKNFQYIG